MLKSSSGLPPNDPNEPGYFVDYTIPVIRFEDDTVLMDSWKIAHELERRYPTPPLHLDDPIVAKVRDHISELRNPLTAQLTVKVPALLNKRSAEYYEPTRAKIFGMSLSQFAQEHGGERNWEEAQKAIDEIAGWLKTNGGPFFLGETGERLKNTICWSIRLTTPQHHMRI